jgi:hypothetical protein
MGSVAPGQPTSAALVNYFFTFSCDHLRPVHAMLEIRTRPELFFACGQISRVAWT